MKTEKLDYGTKVTHLLLDMPLRRALEAAANARAMTMSAWIREAIQEKLKKEFDDEAVRRSA